MYFAVAGLLVIVAIVFYQVFGRYVLNSSPTWAENLALVLVLYVTLIAAAVGVRDAGHIGMESLLVLLPDVLRDRIELVIHAWSRCSAWRWPTMAGSWARRCCTTRSPTSICRRPCATCRWSLSGGLIVLFSIEHIIALLRGEEVEPSWH